MQPALDMDRELRELFPEEYAAADEQGQVAEFVQAKLLRAYTEAFATPAGRIVLHDLLSRTHVFTDCFTGNSKTFLKLGERNIGLYLLNRLEWANLYGLAELRKLEAEQSGDAG